MAVTNQRILDISGGKVTFIAKDYRDGAAKKPVTLDGVEFLRRFCLHILPKRFVKIRRFGIYNHTMKRNLGLQFVPQEKPDIDMIIRQQKPPETNLERFVRLTGMNPCLCPACKVGKMVVIKVLPKIRSEKSLKNTREEWACFTSKPQKNSKSVNKCIAPTPADVVQH